MTTIEDTQARHPSNIPSTDLDALDDGAWMAPDQYPRLFNISAGFMYRGMIRPHVPEPPEYVTVRWRTGRLEMVGTLSQWNVLWEAAQFRRRYFAEDELPREMWRIVEDRDVNVVFVPRTASRYHEHAPLFHLLPLATVQRFGLPPIRAGQWPFMADLTRDTDLPVDFESRLSRAWASTIWRRLVSGSPMRGFSGSDPIRVLAHNLDFWIPPVTAVMESILRTFPEVDKGVEPQPVPLEDGSMLEGAVMGNPRVGSDLWEGEEEAALVLDDVIEAADGTGHLRGVLDAVKSHRVEDDFSDHWTFAREDFERKLHRKRSKVTVRFVELPDTIPVQGPETEVVGQTVHADFLALLDAKEREVVVLLNSGVTKIGDVAEIMGYANHSPVSKRLARIRRKATDFFDEVD